MMREETPSGRLIVGDVLDEQKTTRMREISVYHTSAIVDMRLNMTNKQVWCVCHDGSTTVWQVRSLSFSLSCGCSGVGLIE